ncbi:MAG: hypothetical protein GHCLOJNM_01176 [bacterium]|nr:hypothetical protein [bacterium]
MIKYQPHSISVGLWLLFVTAGCEEGHNLASRCLEEHSDVVTALSLHPTEGTLVSSSWDGKVCLWNLRNSALRVALKGHKAETYINCAKFGVTGSLFATGGDDGNVLLWSSMDAKQVATLDAGIPWAVSCLAMHEGSGLLLAGYANGTVVIWNIETLAEQARVSFHSDDVTAITFSSDGTSGISGGDDGCLVCWNLRSRDIIARTELAGPITDIVLIPDVTTCLVTAYAGNVYILDPSSTDGSPPLAKLDATSVHCDVAKGGSMALLGLNQSGLIHTKGTVLLFDLRNRSILRTLGTVPGGVRDVAISADASLAFAAGGDFVAGDYRVREWVLKNHE